MSSIYDVSPDRLSARKMENFRCGRMIENGLQENIASASDEKQRKKDNSYNS